MNWDITTSATEYPEWLLPDIRRIPTAWEEKMPTMSHTPWVTGATLHRDEVKGKSKPMRIPKL